MTVTSVTRYTSGAQDSASQETLRQGIYHGGVQYYNGTWAMLGRSASAVDRLLFYSSDDGVTWSYVDLATKGIPDHSSTPATTSVCFSVDPGSGVAVIGDYTGIYMQSTFDPTANWNEPIYQGVEEQHLKPGSPSSRLFHCQMIPDPRPGKEGDFIFFSIDGSTVSDFIDLGVWEIASNRLVGNSLLKDSDLSPVDWWRWYQSDLAGNWLDWDHNGTGSSASLTGDEPPRLFTASWAILGDFNALRFTWDASEGAYLPEMASGIDVATNPQNNSETPMSWEFPSVAWNGTEIVVVRYDWVYLAEYTYNWFSWNPDTDVLTTHSDFLDCVDGAWSPGTQLNFMTVLPNGDWLATINMQDSDDTAGITWLAATTLNGGLGASNGGEDLAMESADVWMVYYTKGSGTYTWSKLWDVSDVTQGLQDGGSNRSWINWTMTSHVHAGQAVTAGSYNDNDGTWKYFGAFATIGVQAGSGFRLADGTRAPFRLADGTLGTARLADGSLI